MIKARFYGSSRLPYFEGWYLKQQNGRDTVALIPAIHIDRRGGCSASLQVITNEGSYAVKYPIRQFSVQKRPAVLRLGNNIFPSGAVTCFVKPLNLTSKGCCVMAPCPGLPRISWGHSDLFHLWNAATAYSA